MGKLEAKYPPAPEAPLGTIEEDLERLHKEDERLKRENPDYFKYVAIYALVESPSDQSELLRLCRYCIQHYLTPYWFLSYHLYVDANVGGNEHPPAWTELLGDIEKGTVKGGCPYKIEVLCMFQQAPGIEDFCRQHRVELVIPKRK